jgi:hypothetical protein
MLNGLEGMDDSWLTDEERTLMNDPNNPLGEFLKQGFLVANEFLVTGTVTDESANALENSRGDMMQDMATILKKQMDEFVPLPEEFKWGPNTEQVNKFIAYAPNVTEAEKAIADSWHKEWMAP